MFFGVALAQESSTTAASFFSSIDWSKPTWDLFIILFFLVGAFLYGMSLGRDRVLVLLVSTYMSLAIVEHAPYINQAAVQESINKVVSSLFVFRISAFIAVFIILFFLLSRSALMRTIAAKADTAGSFFHVIIYSVLHVGLLVSIILSFLPAEAVQRLQPLTQQVFTTDLARFIWIVGPVLAMIVLRGEPVEKKEA